MKKLIYLFVILLLVCGLVTLGFYLDLNYNHPPCEDKVMYTVDYYIADSLQDAADEYKLQLIEWYHDDPLFTSQLFGQIVESRYGDPVEGLVYKTCNGEHSHFEFHPRQILDSSEMVIFNRLKYQMVVE